jgi:glycosyltransferase involved in cell wall biosynthesis
MLRDGYSGLLVPPMHAKALARAVAKILDDNIMSEGICKAAKESVKECFSMEKCIAEYESVYEELFKDKITGDRCVAQA